MDNRAFIIEQIEEYMTALERRQNNPPIDEK